MKPFCASKKTKPNKANLVVSLSNLLVPLFILALLGLFAVIFTVSCSKKPTNAVSTANERTESNQQAPDANDKSAKNPSDSGGLPVATRSHRGERPDEQDPNDKKPPRPEHKHPAFKERIEERERMVATQIEARDVNDPNVLKAMRIVPRHTFVPSDQQRYAYADHPLPIGYGQTISQPYIVAFMTEALDLRPDSVVLEIGTGSGYQAAVCAEIAQEVYTIEIVEELAQRAEKQLKELGYKNVFVKAGDGYFGWPKKAPFDTIIGTAAAERIPPPLLEQLKPGGRMILPYETEFGLQYLVLVTKDEKGELHKKNVLPVRFVPMTGEVQKKQK